MLEVNKGIEVIKATSTVHSSVLQLFPRLCNGHLGFFLTTVLFTNPVDSMAVLPGREVWRMLALQCGECGELDPLSLTGGRVEGISVHRFASEGTHTAEGRVCNRGQATGPSGK